MKRRGTFKYDMYMLANYVDEIIKIRRELHKIPESGFNEFKTSNYIKKYLTSIDIVYKVYAKTGIVGYINVENEGDSIAFRSDIDALSLYEMTSHEFKSEHEGFMHACGHDGHMAILLIFAKYISENRDKLKKNIVFIFQPAEEGPGGAEVMINEGLISDFNIKEIFGIHLFPDVDEGTFALRKGAMMARTGEFDIEIIGKSGHGAMPHTAIDAIVIASNLIQSFQSIVSRNIDPLSPAVLTVGKMVCGERRNIIAEKAVLEGTLRAFDEKIYNLIKDKMNLQIEAIEKGFNCKVNIVFRDMYPAVINDEKLTEDFFYANSKDFDVEDIEPKMLAEDFSYYQKEIPGVFVFLGTKNIEKNHVFPLHNSKFDFDEKILINGVKSYINVLIYKKILMEE